MLCREHSREPLQASEETIQVLPGASAKAEMDRRLPRPCNRHDADRPDIEPAALDRVEDRGNRVNGLVDFNIQVAHRPSPPLHLQTNKKPRSEPERGFDDLLSLAGSASQRPLPLRNGDVRVPLLRSLPSRALRKSAI